MIPNAIIILKVDPYRTMLMLRVAAGFVPSDGK